MDRIALAARRAGPRPLRSIDIDAFGTSVHGRVVDETVQIVEAPTSNVEVMRVRGDAVAKVGLDGGGA